MLWETTRFTTQSQVVKEGSLDRQQLRGLQIDYSTSPRTSQGQITPSMQTADAKAFKFQCTPKKAKSRISRELEINLKTQAERAPKAIQGTDGQTMDVNYMPFFPSVKGKLKNTIRDESTVQWYSACPACSESVEPSSTRQSPVRQDEDVTCWVPAHAAEITKHSTSTCITWQLILKYLKYWNLKVALIFGISVKYQCLFSLIKTIKTTTQQNF